MSTFTEILPARKTEKRAAIKWEPDYQRPGCGQLAITGKRCHCTYAVTWFHSDFAGSAFHFEKEGKGSDNESSGYDVFVGPAERLCDCKGFIATGNCKHVDAIQALIDNGWDRMSLVNPDQDVSSVEPPF